MCLFSYMHEYVYLHTHMPVCAMYVCLHVRMHTCVYMFVVDDQLRIHIQNVLRVVPLAHAWLLLHTLEVGS